MATSNHERSKEELYKQAVNDDTDGVEPKLRGGAM